MLRLDSLTIGRYRNVVPTRLEFGPRFNVLLGKNGTGKTTLLKLLGNVIGDDLSPLQEEDDDWEIAFLLTNEEVQLQAEVKSVEIARVAHRSTEPRHGDPFRRAQAVQAHFGLHDGKRSQHWHVRGAEISPPFRPSSYFVGVLDEDFRRNLSYELEDEHGESGDETWESVARTIAHFPRKHPRFDEALASFDSLLASEMTVYPSWNPGRRERSHHIASNLPHRIYRAVYDSYDELTWRTPPWNLPLRSLVRIERCRNLLRADSLNFVPTLSESQGPPVEQSQYEGVRILLERDGRRISHERFSFGQKRLVAFFWHLEACGDAPVIADELVNGLHHEWIEACVAELENQQSFLASQHPLLLDYIPIESVEEARKTFIRCTTEIRDGREMMVWRNLTEDEATRFFEAKQAGIRHVSEILRSQGLW